MEELGGGIDNLVLGTGAIEFSKEQVAEWDARVAAAQARVAKVKKTEKKQKTFDAALATLVKQMPMNRILQVAWLLDSGVPSLTVLSIISIEYPQADRICANHFDKYITEWANLQNLGVEPEYKTFLDHWWTHILAADFVPQTPKVAALKPVNEAWKNRFARMVHELVMGFFRKENITTYNENGYKRTMSEHLALLWGAFDKNTKTDKTEG